MTITFYTMPMLMEQLHHFFSLYDLQQLVISPNQEPILKPESERRCRFCLKTYPQVRFTMKAHTIPSFLGNKYHISDFECDSCNNKFSSYESELKHYLGILPTLTRTKGKKGIPNFHSPKDIITARKSDTPLLKGNIEIQKKDIESDAIVFDVQNGMNTFTYQKPPYTPFNVYKALLKIAISCLPESEARSYLSVSRIFSASDTSSCLPLPKVQRITLPFRLRKTNPAGFLFKKYDPYLKVNTHSFALYYQNIIFQFPIPLHRNDGIIYRSGNVIAPVCPPLFTSETENDMNIKSVTLDLSSTEKKIDDIETWHLSINKEEWKSSVRLNPHTGEWSEVDISTMKDPIGMVLVTQDHNVPLDQSKKIEN